MLRMVSICGHRFPLRLTIFSLEGFVLEVVDLSVMSSQALASMHSAGIAACIHPDTILLCQPTGTNNWKVVVPSAACGVYCSDTGVPDDAHAHHSVCVVPSPAASNEADMVCLLVFIDN